MPEINQDLTKIKSDLLEGASLKFSEDAVQKIQKALDFAEKAHQGAFRKSGEPYITHPIATAQLALELGLDPASTMAALLHDTVEDTDITLQDLELSFGKDVASLVDGLTKVSELRSGMRQIDSYLPQTQSNLSKLILATSRDIRVAFIKLCDRLHNMSTLQYLDPEKRIKIAKETLMIFAPLAERLGMGKLRSQLEELSFKHIDPESYHSIQKAISKYLEKGSVDLKVSLAKLNLAMVENSLSYQESHRTKSIYSVYKKLARKDSLDSVYDLLAVRLIVEDAICCYLTLGLVHQLFQPMPEAVKDYIAAPKSNGYQSLHTTVITKKGHKIEFQIRTKEMHEFAENGAAAAFFYNESKLSKGYKSGSASQLPKDLNWVKEVREVANKISKGDTNSSSYELELFKDQIFVYSPGGDIISLPEGSTPIDFAIKIHSDLAKQLYAVKLNGQIASIKDPLQRGQIVEIITKKNHFAPKPDWYNHIKTEKARHKLNHWLKG